jgi:hypothetical protein
MDVLNPTAMREEELHRRHLPSLCMDVAERELNAVF